MTFDELYPWCYDGLRVSFFFDGILYIDMAGFAWRLASKSTGGLMIKNKNLVGWYNSNISNIDEVHNEVYIHIIKFEYISIHK